MPYDNARLLLRRSLVFLLLAVVFGGGLGVAVNALLSSGYTASSVLLLSGASTPGLNAQAADRILQSEAIFAAGDEVRAAVRDKLPGVEGTYAVTGSANNATLTFTSVAPTAQEAEELARTASQAYTDVRVDSAKDRLQQQIDNAESEVASVRQELSTELARTNGTSSALAVQLQNVLANRLEDVQSLQSELASTDAPADPVSFVAAARDGQSPLVAGAGGAFLGGILALLAVLVRERWTPKVRSHAPVSAMPGSHFTVKRPRRRDALEATTALRSFVQRATGTGSLIYIADLTHSDRSVDLVRSLEEALAAGGRRIAAVGGRDQQDDRAAETVLFRGDSAAADEYFAQELGTEDVVLFLTEQHRTRIDEMTARSGAFTASETSPSLAYLYVHN